VFIADSRSVEIPPGRYRVHRLKNDSEWRLYVPADPTRMLYLAACDGRVPSGQEIADDTAVREFGDPSLWQKLH
jgi:hypothetical protein